jgi:hypothetical protein
LRLPSFDSFIAVLFVGRSVYNTVVLGGGGAEQDPILPGRTSIKLPADYPPDLYWKGQPPKEEYNYVLVDVKPGEKTKFTLNRFRPWSARTVRNRGVVQVKWRRPHS